MKSKKLFIMIQWIGVAALVVYLVRVFMTPVPTPDYSPETWNAWGGFSIISYAGITAHENEENYPSPSRLKEHMTALREAGYEPVRPVDIKRFYGGRAPLPENPVLILFEGGRKDSFIRATPHLRQERMLATMCIPTRFAGLFDRFHLQKNELRKGSRLKHWSFAAMGHQAQDSISVDTEDGTGHFLTRRMYVNGEPESADAYIARVEHDYATSRRILREAVKKAPVLYLYPYADAGFGYEADPLAAEVNRKAVMENFNLAVTREGDSFNGPGSDRYNLTRLRVKGSWTGKELVQQLERFKPKHEVAEPLQNSALWFFEGGARLDNSMLLLPEQSRAWLLGSDGWSDVEVSFTVNRSGNAPFSVYARYAGPYSYIRITLYRGQMLVQERLGGKMQTLLREAVDSAGEEPLEVSLLIKGRRAWVSLNNEWKSPPLPLTASTSIGRVGFESAGGERRISQLEAQTVEGLYRVCESLDAIGPDSLKEVIAIISPWPSETDESLYDDWQLQVLKLAREGVEVIPKVQPDAAMSYSQSRQSARKMVATLETSDVKNAISCIALEGIHYDLAAALRQEGLDVLHIVKPEEARDLAMGISGEEDRLLVVDGEDLLTDLHALLFHYPSHRIIAAHSGATALPSGIRKARWVEPGKGGHIE